MELIVAAIISIVAGVISFLWVQGIDNMKQNHPNYKGEDFLNWDDTHTEGEF